MKVNTIKNEKLGESYYEIKHPSGLTILVMCKPDYACTHAVFATKYGSIDTKIEENGVYREIPNGTAHFLEHKLFESEDIDAFERFAKTGAEANAFTSFDRTAYIFTCSDNFRQNLEILLDFVQSPYFTEETVKKEQGIIGQEIRMYKDVAGWEVMFNLLGALYHEHPVKVDIAGTVESIAEITAETLYGCYRNFYDLNNMLLAVAGSATLEDVLEVADRVLKKAGGKPANREFIRESATPVCRYIEEKLPVNVPRFMLGFKEDIKTPERSLKETVCVEIIHDVIAGKSSPLYKRMLEEGLINTGFSNEYFTGFGFACSFFGGDSNNPGKAAEEIRAEVQKFKQRGIGEKEFERARRKLYGRLVMMYDDVEEIAQNLVDAYLNGDGLFEEIEICAGLTVDDVNENLKEVLCDDNSALSVIMPLKGE